MQIYSVGGAVRDGLLQLPVKDRDFVVVGSTPQEMQALGFTPVGRDFPVFLHPVTHEEYALARTERKTGPGYTGFAFHAAPTVTLEEDLARRDLTINAMAADDSGRIIDPFGGQGDLKARLLRHVGPAFVEDPVRILRVARFAARFFEFSLAPETAALMAKMVDAGEVDALVPERIWQELARGLMEARPSRMFEVLQACGALARIAPELAPTQGMKWVALDSSAAHGRSLSVRCAVWLGETGIDAAKVQSLCLRLRVPSECSDLAAMVVRERGALKEAQRSSPVELLGLLERCDALRRGERFELLLEAFEELESSPGVSPRARLQRALQRVRDVDAGAIARTGPKDIGSAVRAARLDALTKALL
jgi:tRNA nucleotidyltransferase (CCA-adding enzyme)